jgi:hypothetical protein
MRKCNDEVYQLAKEKINHIKIFYSETEMIFSWPTFKIMYLNVTPTLHPKWMELNGKNEIESGKTLLWNLEFKLKTRWVKNEI